MEITKEQFEAAKAVSEEGNFDVMLLNGAIERGIDSKFIIQVKKKKKAKNFLLITVTPGGSADAAYRVARYAQENYEKFVVFVSGYCKSAGTLCVLGANEIIMSDQGELGPLDVQIYKRDELGEMGSGLVIMEAMDRLQERAFEMFEDYLLAIEEGSGGLITLKTATDVAAKLAIGLFEPIYRQVDPSSLGDISRSMTIAKDYGTRLQVSSRNFTDDALNKLVSSYPSHGFVIDRREAQNLFKIVRIPTEKQDQLAKCLAPKSRVPVSGRETILEFLYPNVEAENAFKPKESDDASQSAEQAAGTARDSPNAEERKGGNGGDPSPSGGEDSPGIAQAIRATPQARAGRK